MADGQSKAEYDQRWHDAWQQGVPQGRVGLTIGRTLSHLVFRLKVKLPISERSRFAVADSQGICWAAQCNGQSYTDPQPSLIF